MEQQIRKVIVIGGGSAGFLSALTLKIKNPHLHVALIKTDTIPIIGVGEATTNYFPRFLHHYLGLDRKHFYDDVKPSWKLGIRFEWGPAILSHFNYPFGGHAGGHLTVRHRKLRKIAAYYCLDDMSGASLISARMDLGKSPLSRTPEGTYTFDENIGYHIENTAFVSYLEKEASHCNIDIINRRVVQVHQTESGYIRDVTFDDGSFMTADLFVDCSGFQSLLLGKTLKEEYISYADSLFCDSAVTGSWQREKPIRPYTLAESMENGWCWGIELRDRVNRGYVYSSSFCDEAQAIDEMKAKNPFMDNNFKTIKFKSGRYKNFWVKNVAAIGNAGGFVEPLQSTGLHMICQAASLVGESLLETDMRPTEAIKKISNETLGRIWDDLRWFISIHYKYNSRIQSKFWKHCNNNTNISGIKHMIDAYEDIGPSHMLETLIDPLSVFKFDGYLTILIGQDVQSDFKNDFDDEELKVWQALRADIRKRATESLSMEEAFQLLDGPQWKWPR